MGACWKVEGKFSGCPSPSVLYWGNLLKFTVLEVRERERVEKRVIVERSLLV